MSADVAGAGLASGARVEIDLRAGGKGQEYLIAGWSFPETEYTWTLGKRSLVRFPRTESGYDCSLRFRTGPMVRQGQVSFQRLVVEVNGTIAGRLVVRMPTQYELCVPAEALTGHDAVEIAFHMPDALPPSALGDSGDTRDLGVWLSSLQFGSLQQAARPTAAAEAADKVILMDVQSLGENCELGFVQRFRGAEPLGLFRWAATPLPNLLAALEGRFAGLGDPAQTVVEADEVGEFQVFDRRYGFRNHSFAFQNAGARQADILKRELVRLPFLARLLTEELEQGAKLFCFHDAGASGLDRIERLVEELNQFGPNTLLWVCAATAPEQVGTAEVVNERLIRGYIDRFQPIHNVRAPSAEAWMGAVRAAHALWRQRRPA